MKKLKLCILCLILVIGLSGCSFGSLFKNPDTKNPNGQTNVQNPDDEDQAKYKDYVFVGDSRFVGMKGAVKSKAGNDIEFVAKVGEGLSWLKKQAPDLYQKTGKTIIFNFGVNDLHNASKYVDFYNSMPEEFMKKNTLVFMTVNPVDEAKEAEHGYKIKNKDIEKFNNKMKSGLDKQYFHIIDTNTYIQLKDFKTTDGLHYNNDTYKLIFKYAVKCCEEKDFVRR